MSNASNESSQDPARTPVLRSNEGHVTCPTWCIGHKDWDPGSPEDHVRVHYGERLEVAGKSIEINRYDWLQEGRPGAVSVMLDDDFLTPQEATALAGALATTAAKDTADEKIIVRTLELPAGQDYVVMDDVGVVCLSSSLDQARRLEVLSELGLS